MGQRISSFGPFSLFQTEAHASFSAKKGRPVHRVKSFEINSFFTILKLGLKCDMFHTQYFHKAG